MPNPIATSIKSYRYKHDMTQAELATLTNIPRATLANMESECGNPSLKAVIKIADALGVSMEDLLEPHKTTPTYTYVKRAELPTARRNDNKYEAMVISPVSAPYTRIISVNMLPGCYTVGAPHPKGSHEFFHCIDGTATLDINGEVVDVYSGDLLYFPGNLPHIYSNNGTETVRALAIVNNFEANFKR